MPFPRIAALQPSVSVTLAALGRLDHLAACTQWCVGQVPELAETTLPVLEDSWSATEADLAVLDSAAVDIVLASVPYRMEALAAILKHGQPVLAFAPHSLAEIDADTRLLAALVNAPAEGEQLIGKMHAAMADVREKVGDAQSLATKPRVYCEEWGKPLIHSQPWVYELASACGGVAVGQPGSHTRAEEIAAADPDLLLLAWCGAADRVPLERVVAQRGWQHLRCVRERRVYCVPDEFLNTPAIPSLLDGLACVAAAIHPEIFATPARLRRVAEPAEHTATPTKSTAAVAEA